MVVFDDVLGRIEVERRQVDVGRMLLTAIAAVLYGIGWTVARTVTVLGVVLSWSAAAVRVGWADVRPPKPAHL